VGACDTFESSGQSSIWTTEGVLIAQLDYQNEGCLIFDTENEEIIEKVL
jgi:hypothetical protein